MPLVVGSNPTIVCVAGIAILIVLFAVYEHVARKGDAKVRTIITLAFLNTLANLCLNFVAQMVEQGLL